LNKESLETIRDDIIKLVSYSEIDKMDKIELLLNLYHFLDPEKYEKNIKILKKQKNLF